MREIGFEQGAASPCVFVHRARNIATFVRGDDFISCALTRQLDRPEATLEKKYELKRGGRLGPGPEDSREIMVLNRVLRWTWESFKYEADPRQAERLSEGFELDDSCNGAATPGVKPQLEQVEIDETLGLVDANSFGALAAGSNYLSADRLDLQFSCTETCRHMANPGGVAQAALKRLGRYLLETEEACLQVAVASGRRDRDVQRYGLCGLSDHSQEHEWRTGHARPACYPSLFIHASLSDFVFRRRRVLWPGQGRSCSARTSSHNGRFRLADSGAVVDRLVSSPGNM